VNRGIWIKCNAIAKNACPCCPKKINQVHALFQFAPKHTTYFAQFISVGFQQTMGLPVRYAYFRYGHPANDGKDVGEQRYLDKM